MNRVLAVLLVVLLLAVGGLRLRTPKSHEQQVRNYVNAVLLPSTALMYGTDQAGSKRFICTSSAFSRVSDGYLFLTAAHCVTSGVGPFFLSPDTQNPEVYYPASVVAYGDISKDQDFAVLHITADAKAFSLIDIGRNPSQLGEGLISVSATAGVGKSVLHGAVSILAIPHDIIVNTPGYQDNWKGDVLFQMPGGGGGASGASITCEDQMKVCAIFTGTGPAGMVAEPIEKFIGWWASVQDGETDPKPPLPDAHKDVLILQIIKAIGEQKH